MTHRDGAFILGQAAGGLILGSLLYPDRPLFWFVGMVLCAALGYLDAKERR